MRPLCIEYKGEGQTLEPLGQGQMPTTGLNFITNRKFMAKLEEGWERF